MSETCNHDCGHCQSRETCGESEAAQGQSAAGGGGCTHDCSTCTANCGSKKQDPKSFLAAPHALSRIDRVIGIVSGKGGVGKSLVTSMLAVLARRAGRKTAVLDADITGPSIPRAFGVESEKVAGVEEMDGQKGGMLPVRSKGGISIMSLNLLMEHATDPVIWRGPVIAGAVKQFWTDVIWNDVDRMFIDMPPGTGDVPLTVFQSIPVSGIIIVASPQELVGMIVEKAFRMAQMMNIPVLGLVENMSYAICPDCGKKLEIFGRSRLEETAARFGIANTAQIPIDPALAAAVDAGKIEDFQGDWLNKLFDACLL